MKYEILTKESVKALKLPMAIEELFLDTETTSFDSKQSSVNPWRNCWIGGVAFSWDENPVIYFLPLRYRSGGENVDLESGYALLNEVFTRAKLWINHNIKYDYHVLSREGVKVHDVPLYCTLTQAKLIASDRLRYNEDSLAADWLKEKQVDIHKQAMLPWIEASKDWGEVPISKMAPYACHDIDKNRRLYKYIKANMHPDVYGVSKEEQDVTRCLCRCEQVGLNINEEELLKAEYSCNIRMKEILERIHKLHGALIRPNVNSDCYELFNGKFGLPVVAYTEKSKDPSYDKYALATLLQYPTAPKELIEDCIEYRKLVSHNGFVKAYRKHALNGRIHSSYNQCVRTGRKACKEPNMMQLSKAEKELIHPPEGFVFLSFDFSAIEFRLLAHYLNQPEILEAYQKDPDTDFHQWVADMCQVQRKPAKNINFCMAYGGGQKKVLSMLANNADIIEQLAEELKENISPEEFEHLCQIRAKGIFDKYHRILHRLKPLTRMAANRSKVRGFVKNGKGRHRHLPKEACYRALNTVIQSYAADIQKQAVVATSPIFNSFIRDRGIEQVAYVHDEILFICPRIYIEDVYFDVSNTEVVEEKPFYKTNLPKNEVITHISNAMISSGSELSVPLRMSAAIGVHSWAGLTELPKELIYQGV